MGLYDRLNLFDDTRIDDATIANQLAAFKPPAVPQPQSQPESSSLLRRVVGDTAVTALKGAIGLPESIVGLADIPTGGRVGKALEEVGYRPREAKQTLDELYSPEQKAANANVHQAKGFLPTISALAENPSVVAHTALESAPSLLGGAGIARGALKAAPKLAPYVAGAIGEGAMSAGQTAEAIRGENPDHLLTPKQSALSGLSGLVTGGIGTAAGKFANKANIANIETMLAGGSGNTINKGMVRQVAEGALTEGVLEELPQSMQEQALKNIAQGKPWNEGVTEAGAQGMVTGGLMGAGGGGFNAVTQHPTASPQPADQNASQPIQPVSDGALGSALAAAGIGKQQIETVIQEPKPLNSLQEARLQFLQDRQDNGAELTDSELQLMEKLKLRSAGPATSELLGGPSEFRTPVTMPQPDELALANHWADQQIAAGKTYLMNVRSYDRTGQNLIAEWKKQTGYGSDQPAADSMITADEPPADVPAVQEQPPAVQTVQEKVNSLIASIRQGQHTPETAFQELYALPEYKSLSLQPQQQGDTAIGVDGDAEDYIYQQFEQAAAGQPRIQAAQPARPAPKVKGLNPEKHDLITAIAKLGGINRDQAVTQWGSSIKDSVKDLNLHATRNGGSGLLYAVHSKGKPLDTMRELLEEQGYLPPGSSIEDLYSKIEAATRGQHSYSQQHQATLEQNMSDYPFDVSDLDPDLDQSIMYALKHFDEQTATHAGTVEQNTATETPSPQKSLLFNLTHDVIAQAFPKQTITESPDGFTVTMKNGTTIRINGTDTIEFNTKAAETAYGRKLQDDEKPVASFQRMGQDAVISLTEAGTGEIHHETFHAAMALALNQSQRATLLGKFGNEETAAQEYQRLRDSNSFEQKKGHLWLRAIHQFFQKVRGLFNPALKVMQDIASGDVWNGTNASEAAAPAYSLKTTLERIATSRTRPNDTIRQPEGMTAGIASTDPAIEQRWQTAHGLSDGPGLKERLQGFLQRMLSERQHFPNLDMSSFSGKRTADILRRFESSDTAARAKTAEYLHSLTASFGPQKMDLFSRKVVLDDLINEADKGRALPFGYTPETVKADHERISKLVEANPDVQAAINHRTEVSKQLVLELVDNDLLPVESVLTPEGLENYKQTGTYGADDINTGYFRHQVLQHANARKWAGISTAGEVRNKQRGWQKGREGSELDINTNFLEAEFEYYAQALKELATKKVLDEVLSINDLAPALQEQAKQEGAADWKALTPEGYTTWQPEKGSVFYKGQTMPESIITRFVEQNPAFAEVAQKFKEVLILGGRKEEVVIPEGLAKTLDNLRTNREDATLDTINKKLIGGWKVWTLLSPRRALKYNLNNMSGDLDIVLAADPGILKHFNTAWKNALNRKAGQPMTFEELAMLDRGVIDAGISINEIPDISKLPGFQHLKEGTRNVKLMDALKTGDLTKLAPANLIAKYFDKVSSLTQLREGLLREAAYLRAKDLLDQGKTIYWASKPAEINSLTNTRDKAAKLSRELLGDYGNLSAHGEKIRTSLIPFWSWMEINAPRYYRLFKNAATQGEAGSTAARMAGVGARKAAGAALGIGEKVLLTHLLFAAVSAFNHLVHPEEEEKLSAQVRGQLHLILGTTRDGKTLTLRFSGAFSDVLAWAGLEDYPESFKKLETGRMDAREMLKKMALATPNKLVNAASPFTKLAGELMTGKSIYPDMTKPMPIRDRTEHVARFFALDEEYKALAGKPGKGYLNSLKNLLVYESDPGENAYHDIKQQVGRFLEKHGREQTTAEPTERSKALYYFRQAMKYRDKEAIDKYKAEYLKAGGKPENLYQSIKRQHPLAGMPLHMRQQFLKSLSAQDRENVKLAIDWHKQAYR